MTSTPAAAGINHVAKAFAEGLESPVWSGTLEAFLASMLTGPVAGTISGFINNVTYGLTLSPILTVYATTSIGIGITVRVLYAKGWLSSTKKVFASVIIITIVSAVTSTPLNVVLWGGQAGILWGDSISVAMIVNHIPVWTSPFTDELILDILNKVAVAYLVFFIYRQLLRRMIRFLRDDK